MNYSAITKLKNCKKRRILVLSCSGPAGGIQSLYFSVSNNRWEILSSSSLPYPQKIVTGFETLSSPLSCCGETIGRLDYRLSQFFTEAAKTTLSTTPTALRKPHAIVLNTPSLWKGNPEDDLPQVTWEVPIGDAQHCATTLQTPVFTQILRNTCIEGETGMLPTHDGDLHIATTVGGVVIFINIGMITRVTIVDSRNGTILLDADSGPGTCCIDAIVKRYNLSASENFDRDGTLSSQGQVNGSTLDIISSDKWFLEPLPKRALTATFNHFIDHPSLVALTPLDQLATITALTARSIYDFYRRAFTLAEPGQTVLVSGGGSLNQTLLGYLQTYFDTIPVKSVESIGIPPDMRIPLALGLTVNAYFSGTERSSPGRWVLP